MVEDYRSLTGVRYSIPWKSWPFIASMEDDGSVIGLHDQHYIHNGKKMINPLGNDLVTLNHVALVYQSFKVDDHGLQEGDIERKDRQNWRSSQRIAGRKVQNFLELLQMESNHCQERTLGTKVYLSIVVAYIDT